MQEGEQGMVEVQDCTDQGRVIWTHVLLALDDEDAVASFVLAAGGGGAFALPLEARDDEAEAEAEAT